MSIPPPRFRVARPGYEIPAVDAFIERVARGLETNPVRITAEGVRRVRFPLAQSKPGYAVADVDAWVGHVVAALAADETSQRAHAVPAPAPPLASGSTTVHRVSGRGRSAAADPGRHAIQELPATPVWVRVTALLVILGMVGLFVFSYFF